MMAGYASASAGRRERRHSTPTMTTSTAPETAAAIATL
jgi:hypothetical protein